MSSLHDQAFSLSRNYLQIEKSLITVLQLIDKKRAYREKGFPSLFQYCLGFLKLSESQSYALIAVSRKATEVPALKVALDEGKISVSQAKRITSVITLKNQDRWIEKAGTLTQKQIEKEVAKENPKLKIREKITPVSQDRHKLTCGISERLLVKIERAKEILAQKGQRHFELEATLESALDVFLKSHDPLEQKSPSLRKAEPKTMSRSRKVAVMQRDEGKCQYPMEQGICGQARWLDVHHKIEESQGGAHALSNLTLLCRGHHQALHEEGVRKLDTSRVECLRIQEEFLDLR